MLESLQSPLPPKTAVSQQLILQGGWKPSNFALSQDKQCIVTYIPKLPCWIRLSPPLLEIAPLLLTFPLLLPSSLTSLSGSTSLINDLHMNPLLHVFLYWRKWPNTKGISQRPCLMSPETGKPNLRQKRSHINEWQYEHPSLIEEPEPNHPALSLGLPSLMSYSLCRPILFLSLLTSTSAFLHMNITFNLAFGSLLVIFFHWI